MSTDPQAAHRPDDPVMARMYDHFLGLGVDPVKAREVVDNTVEEG